MDSKRRGTSCSSCSPLKRAFLTPGLRARCGRGFCLTASSLVSLRNLPCSPVPSASSLCCDSSTDLLNPLSSVSHCVKHMIHWSACVVTLLCDVDCRWLWPSQACLVLHDRGVAQRNRSLNSREMSHAIRISWLHLSQTISTHQAENLGQEGLL